MDGSRHVLDERFSAHFEVNDFTMSCTNNRAAGSKTPAAPSYPSNPLWRTADPREISQLYRLSATSACKLSAGSSAGSWQSEVRIWAPTGGSTHCWQSGPAPPWDLRHPGSLEWTWGRARQHAEWSQVEIDDEHKIWASWPTIAHAPADCSLTCQCRRGGCCDCGALDLVALHEWKKAIEILQHAAHEAAESFEEDKRERRR